MDCKKHPQQHHETHRSLTTSQPSGPIKARLVFVHGYSEHVNRYNDFFPKLAAQGIHVFAWDQRGWGRSAPTKSMWGHTGPTSQVIADVVAFIKDKASDKSAPLFVMGHSMGGGQVCTLMADPAYADLVAEVRGWLLESPFIGFTPNEEPSFLKVYVGRLVGRLLPKQQLRHEVVMESLSRDTAWVESVRNDPLCHNTGTLEGLANLLDRTAALSSGTSKVLPNVRSIWLGHGSNDMTCSHSKAMTWLEQQTGVQDKTAKSYEGAYHQLHADHCKEEFAADVTSWILQRAVEAPVEAKL